MSNIKAKHKGCRDVFHAYLVKDAEYDGTIEIPVIKPSEKVPNRIISFSEAMKTDDLGQWVHFYENDCKIECIWNNPRKYIARLRKFSGLITPDFSMYRDMPLVMQAWNTYRGKALGHWWQSQGLNVIPNVRCADERSYSFCCDGVSERSTICIGSYGCLRDKKDRALFGQGLKFIIERLKPLCIVVYGGVPDDIFSCCTDAGIKILHFPGGFHAAKRAVSA